MRKSNEKIENGPALPAVQQRVLKKLREKSKISQFIKNSPNCCICNFCKGGKDGANGVIIVTFTQ